MTTFPSQHPSAKVTLPRLCLETSHREQFTRHAPRQKLPALIPYRVRLGGLRPASRDRHPSRSGRRIIAFAGPLPISPEEFFSLLLLLLRTWARGCQSCRIYIVSTARCSPPITRPDSCTQCRTNKAAGVATQRPAGGVQRNKKKTAYPGRVAQPCVNVPMSPAAGIWPSRRTAFKTNKNKTKNTKKLWGGQHKGLRAGEQRHTDTLSSSSLGRADDRQGCRTDITIDRSSPLIARPDSCTHFATKTKKCTQMLGSWAA